MHDETEKQEYERPTLTAHGEFGAVTAGKIGGRSEPGGGRFGF
ncbi:lasso RiPP family leader peptide-containing protein [Kribbella antibiotica]|uniref:Lasso RiPP family leader peptide-containing protein n=1 Tax=Kribbella antibiotica TaxID=190195 RepID=A0A4R4ZWQ7_9ACTN|nr:lasso RiPP family leader peptide-containing protein [Kribbella antibiotica]TDD63000.1 lasso RiPP family leader peptide-containing protein [Kribbella antibiotica]